MADALDDLQNWLAPLLASLEPKQVNALAREVARKLRADNQKNMRAQRDPDGKAWEGRKKAKPVGKPIRYMYRKKYGGIRELEMSSWRDGSDRVTGYDKEAGGIRTMLKKGMLRSLAPQHGNVAPKSAKSGQKMMEKLRTARHLKAQAQEGAAVVQFMGRAQRLAAIHHFGLRDRVRKGGPEYNYPARELLGITEAQMDAIASAVLDNLTEGY